MIRDAYSSACSLSFANLFADALSIRSSLISSLVIFPSSLLSALNEYAKARGKNCCLKRWQELRGLRHVDT
jgi:hypothetical protein